jgi:prepilin-type N-terminal cleavage/methylation domain-containing protein
MREGNGMLKRLLAVLKGNPASGALMPDGTRSRGGTPAKARCGKDLLQGQGGFTMVELLISILVMSVAIFGVIGMQTVALKSNTVAHQLSIGSALAQQVLEDILALPIDNRTVNTTNTSTSAPYIYGAVNLGTVRDGGFPVSPATSPPTYTTFMDAPNGGRYTATYTTLVGSSANGIPTGVSRITVTVNYSNSGTAKSVTMTGFKRTT